MSFVTNGLKVALVILAAAHFNDRTGVVKLLAIIAIAAVVSVFYRLFFQLSLPREEDIDQCLLFFTQSVCSAKTTSCAGLRKQLEKDEEYKEFTRMKCSGNDVAALFARERLEQSYSKENYPLCDTGSLLVLLDNFRCPERSPAFFIAVAAFLGSLLAINAKFIGVM